MRAKRLNPFLFLLPAILLLSCKKSEDFQTGQISDYVPLQTGKYITYRLDSTVFTNFGRTAEIHSYLEKHLVDQQLPDALGRPSYRIFRYLNDTTGTTGWVSAGTYFITAERNTVELIENNLRFVKLALPLKTDNTWKGNRYLPDEPYSALYSFNNDFDMASWDYTISATDETLQLNGKTISDVITIDGINEVINMPVTIPSAYGSINYQQDKYAKNIGLVYQELTMWEYQPNTSGTGGGFYVGFGIKRSMTDHN